MLAAISSCVRSILNSIKYYSILSIFLLKEKKISSAIYAIDEEVSFYYDRAIMIKLLSLMREFWSCIGSAGRLLSAPFQLKPSNSSCTNKLYG